MRYTRCMKQSGRLVLAERLRAWLRAQGRSASARALSIDAGCAENAVSRILRQPERATERDTWERLARHLGWEVEETLALAGYGQTPEPAGDDPDFLMERAMELRGLEEDARRLIRALFALAQRLPPPTSGPPGHRGGSPPTAGRSASSPRAMWQGTAILL
jgi:hypothetical protein